MIFKIKSNLNTDNKTINNAFKAKAIRFLNLNKFNNSNEYQKWDKYIKENYKISLYDALLKIIEYSNINIENGYYNLNIVSIPIKGKLYTTNLINLLNNGNLDIRKTYLFSNLIIYSFENM